MTKSDISNPPIVLVPPTTSSTQQDDKLKIKRVQVELFGSDSDKEHLENVPEYDKGYEIDKDKLEILAYAFKRRVNVMMVGPKGCGKTSFGQIVASLLSAEMARFPCSGESSVDDLIGKWIVKGGQMEWIDGVGTDAYKTGKVLLLDEVDSATPPVLFALHSLLESNSDRFELSAKGHETIMKHKNFLVIATANTLGHGDDSFMYAGTNILNQAFLDRFSVTMQFDYMKEAQERRVLINKTGISKELADKMCKIANDARESFVKEEITSVVSTRKLLDWATMTHEVQEDKKGVKEFAEFTILNQMKDDDRAVVKELINKHISSL